MADLEDRILRQNVPGRWSTHDELPDRSSRSVFDVPDGEEGENEEDGSDIPVGGHGNLRRQEEDENDVQMLALANRLSQQDIPEPIARSIVAERERKHATGVKAVLADYKAQCQFETAIKQVEAARRAETIRSIVMGNTRVAGEQAVDSLQTMQATKRERQMQAVQQQQQGLGDAEFEDDDDEEEEDDAFMREYRAKRLQELKAVSALPDFRAKGCEEVLSADTFLRALEDEDKRVFVVVHLYEPGVQCCVKTNNFLDALSKSIGQVKFLRMNASKHNIAVDKVALPILNIYKAGNCVKVLAGLEQELGKHFTQADLEWLVESTLAEL